MNRKMFERLRSPRQPAGDRKLVPLRIQDLPTVAPQEWAFGYSDMAEAISASPELAWRIDGTREYIIGGRWRRRHEIGVVEELHAKGNRGRLARHLANELREEGAPLLIVGTSEQTYNLGFYLTEGYELIDEIVRYQRNGADVPAPDPVVTVRDYADADLPDVLRVDQAAFPWLWWNSEEEFRWYTSLPGIGILVALGEKGEIAGYAGFTISGRQGHLDRLAVQPTLQGRGLGRALVCHTLAYMARRRVERVALTTQVDNYKSASLYRSLGFARTTVRYPVYGLWLAKPDDDDRYGGANR
ncbi:MAG: GNAT family N-acetyltransferase [Chloroflexota bacterium]